MQKRVKLSGMGLVLVAVLLLDFPMPHLVLAAAPVDLGTGVTGILRSANGGVGQTVTPNQDYYMLPFGLGVTAGTGVAVAAGSIRAAMFTLDRQVTLTRMGVYIQTASAGGNYVIGIYSTNASIAAATLLVQGVFSTTTAGNAFVTVPSTTLIPGTYFMAWGSDNAVATTTSSTGLMQATGSAVLLNSGQIRRLGILAAVLSGTSLPASFSLTTTGNGISSPGNQNPPFVLVEP